MRKLHVIVIVFILFFGVKFIANGCVPVVNTYCSCENIENNLFPRLKQAMVFERGESGLPLTPYSHYPFFRGDCLFLYIVRSGGIKEWNVVADSLNTCSRKTVFSIDVSSRKKHVLKRYYRKFHDSDKYVVCQKARYLLYLAIGHKEYDKFCSTNKCNINSVKKKLIKLKHPINPLFAKNWLSIKN